MTVSKPRTAFERNQVVEFSDEAVDSGWIEPRVDVDNLSLPVDNLWLAGSLNILLLLLWNSDIGYEIRAYSK